MWLDALPRQMRGTLQLVWCFGSSSASRPAEFMLQFSRPHATSEGGNFVDGFDEAENPPTRRASSNSLVFRVCNGFWMGSALQDETLSFSKGSRGWLFTTYAHFTLYSMTRMWLTTFKDVFLQKGSFKCPREQKCNSK
jgi:hypothetical protein